MTDVVCKACGAVLGDIEDYEAGDHASCPDCAAEYDFEENSNPAYDQPVMVNDPDVYDRPKPAIEEVISVDENEDGDDVVTWLRSDGVQIKEYADDFAGEIPEGEA
jgi:hypothetical protein